MPPTSTLTAIVGAEYTVASVDVAEGPRRRLAELGMRPGAVVRVLQRTSGGGLVVTVSGSRIAVDRRTAASIHVEKDS